jgi:hypothetical protein
MGPVLSLILIGGCVVVAVGALSVWLAIKRPARSMERRARDEALAAAERYTPAPRQSVYGPPAPPDPCAPGLSDHERVQAMRALLQRGDTRTAAMASAAEAQADAPHGFAATQPAMDDEVTTTTPMAWKPTLPPDEADAIHERQARLQRAHGQNETVPSP